MEQDQDIKGENVKPEEVDHNYAVSSSRETKQPDEPGSPGNLTIHIKEEASGEKPSGGGGDAVADEKCSGGKAEGDATTENQLAINPPLPISRKQGTTQLPGTRKNRTGVRLRNPSDTHGLKINLESEIPIIT